MDLNEKYVDQAESNGVKVPVKNTEKKIPCKIKEALALPTCMNINPRSIYNKIQEFITLVQEENIQCVFLSESFERPEFDLSRLIRMEDYTVISNPH